MHKIAFFHPMGASGATCALYLKLFTQKDCVAVLGLLVKQRISFSEPSFGGLGSNVICDSSLARWKVLSRIPIDYNSTFF